MQNVKAPAQTKAPSGLVRERCLTPSDISTTSIQAA
jgi:hypothetical protein